MINKDVKHAILAVFSIFLIVGFAVLFSGDKTIKLHGYGKSSNFGSVPLSKFEPDITKNTVTGLAEKITIWQWFIRGCIGSCAVPVCSKKTYSRTEMRKNPNCDVDFGWKVTCRDLITDQTFPLKWQEHSDKDCDCLDDGYFTSTYPVVSAKNVVCATPGREVNDRCYYGGELYKGIVCDYWYNWFFIRKDRYCGYCKGDVIKIQSSPETGHLPKDLPEAEQPTPKCTDTDNGKNYTSKGTTSGANGIFTDYCSYKSTVVEYYCYSNGYVGNTGHYCVYGCSNGICRSAPLNAPIKPDSGSEEPDEALQPEEPLPQINEEKPNGKAEEKLYIILQ